MANDERYGGDRWRDRDQGRGGGSDRDRDFRERSNQGWNEGRREASGWGPGVGGGDRERQGGDDDRGFFQRAGEELRSWIGRGDDRGGDSADRRWQGRRDDGSEDRGSDYGPGGSYGYMARGWGNQSGESWNRDRPGERGWFTDSIGGERGERYGAGAGEGNYGGGHGVPRAEHWEGTGFSGPSDRGRRFDRIDAGGTGTHGAHPMSSPVGQGFGSGGPGSSSRYAAVLREQGGGGGHDPHYSEWRRRQIEELDRDYDEWRREHQSKFEQEFGSWRAKRQSQRQLLDRVTEQMKVLGSDGTPVGTVDKVRGDRIILTKGDENAGGMHHSIPCSWLETVDEQVTLNRTADEAMSEWRNEDRNRALFERPEQGSEGPHMLNRSFAGTYSDRDRDRDE